jgi:hypothetical protein
LDIAIAQRIDSYSVEGTITASAGSGVISVGDDDFTITYASSATVTAGNFVTAHGAALLALGITVTNTAGLLTFTAATQALVDSITFTATDEEDDFDVARTAKQEYLNYVAQRPRKRFSKVQTKVNQKYHRTRGY